MKNVMVSVVIAAFNHERFIKDAIESVLNQNTNFCLEILIHDDASVDDTPNIIRSYEKRFPEIIKTVYEKENQFQKGRLREALFDQDMSGKYFAILDGDDYWTDISKLQRQVDFMEAHEEFSMCMHNAVQLNSSNGETRLLNTFEEDGEYSQEEQILSGLGTNFPAFGSCLFRTSYLKDIPNFFLKSGVGDYALRQYYADCGKVYYDKKPMSVYRIAVSGSYMNKLKSDSVFYNSYTLKMLNFLEQFDEYTGKRFHDIFEEKIISDYFGFCSSVEETEGIKKASEMGLDLNFVKKCYRCLATDYLDTGINQLCSYTNGLFIYGTSRLGLICKRQLEHAGIEFEGFVVSDGQIKPQTVKDKKVFYLSEVKEKYENPRFILAVQPINEKSIIKSLGKYGFTKYCKPYDIESTGKK